MPDQIYYSSISEQGKLIRDRQLSPVELAQIHLERINTINPQLNAFITILEEQALRDARRIEDKISTGNYLPPLYGIPFAPKDNFATKGVLTTNGSRFFEHYVPDTDADVIKLLKKSGAILIGKLALHEFAAGSYDNDLFGIVKNPWNQKYKAGGSSSGSGAAVSSGMVPMSLGTDTGGSVRGPAALCGIVGLKTTYGLINRKGITPLCWSLDTVGLMTRYVKDCALLLSVIAGTERNEDQYVYTKTLSNPIKDTKIGIIDWFFHHADPEVSSSVRHALLHLEDLGAELISVDIPHISYVSPAWRCIQYAEQTAFHDERFMNSPDFFDSTLRNKLGMGYFISAVDYLKANRMRRIIIQEYQQAFEQVDVIITPGMPTAAESIYAEEKYNPDKPENKRISTTNFANLIGFPALVMPCGFTKNGLPISIQITGKPFDEAFILQVANQYEITTETHKKHPVL